MIYEIEIAWRTLRKEGPGPLLKKLRIYVRQLFGGVRFFFLRMPRQATPTELVDFSFHAAGGLLQTSQVRPEIIQLAEWVGQRRPKTVVEIGTAHGGTLFLWCRLADPQATIVSIDLPGGIHGGGYPYWKSWIYRRFRLARQTLRLLRGDSHRPEMLAQLKSILPGDGKVDFLFIDGDHTYAGVKADFEMYSPLVRPGGLVVFHDICEHPGVADCQVDRFWREVKNERRAREFVDNPNQGNCGIGVIEM
jgi:predicted O-methyltransferase YrrM